MFTGKASARAHEGVVTEHGHRVRQNLWDEAGGEVGMTSDCPVVGYYQYTGSGTGKDFSQYF